MGGFRRHLEAVEVPVRCLTRVWEGLGGSLKPLKGSVSERLSGNLARESEGESEGEGEMKGRVRLSSRAE